MGLLISRDLADKLKTLDSFSFLAAVLEDRALISRQIEGATCGGKYLKESISIWNQLTDKHESVECRKGLAVALGKASVFYDFGLDEAQKMNLKSLQIFHDLADHLHTPEELRNYAEALNEVSWLSHGCTLSEEEAYQKESLSVFRRLILLQPTPDNLYCFWRCLGKIDAGTIFDDENFSFRSDIRAERLKISRSLVDLFETPQTLECLSIALQAVSNTAELREDYASAEMHQDESLSILRGLAKRTPTPRIQRELANSILAMSSLQEKLGHHEARKNFLMEALKIKRGLAERFRSKRLVSELRAILIFLRSDAKLRETPNLAAYQKEYDEVVQRLKTMRNESDALPPQFE